MKTPRVHDFDPDAKIPELGSPLDNMPVITRPQAHHEKPVYKQEETTLIKEPVLPVPIVPLVPPVRPVRDVPLVKRIMKQRHPFDIYHDQYDTLKQFADEERRQGGMGSMSAMVREALDTFITARRKLKKGKST